MHTEYTHGKKNQVQYPSNQGMYVPPGPVISNPPYHHNFNPQQHQQPFGQYQQSGQFMPDYVPPGIPLRFYFPYCYCYCCGCCCC